MKGDYTLTISKYVHDLISEAARREGIGVNQLYGKIFYRGCAGIMRGEERDRLREEFFEERIEGGISALLK